MKKVSIEKFDQARYELETKAYEMFPDRKVTVSVHPFDKVLNAKVSWASIGTVTADQAEEFMKDIQKAVELANSFKYNGYAIGEETEEEEVEEVKTAVESGSDFWDMAAEDLNRIREEWKENQSRIAARNHALDEVAIHISYMEHMSRHIAAMAIMEGATGLDLSGLATEMYHESPSDFQSHMYRVVLLASMAAMTWEKIHGALKRHADLSGFSDEDWDTYSAIAADMDEMGKE